jgi:hypothetical protein
MLTNEGKGIGKRGKSFRIPSGLLRLQSLTVKQVRGDDRHERKESQQHWRRSEDG